MSTQASRPIANFHPSTWDDHFLNFSTLNKATDDVQKEQEIELKQLKEKLKNELLATANKPIEQLKFTDALERLGVAYHFETELEAIIEHMYKTYNDQKDQDDLYHTSIRFRILRQHGFYVSCDVFNKYKDDKGSFTCSLSDDVRGMLSLYEAAHVCARGDDILDEALAFTTTYLKFVVNSRSSPLTEEVAHALHQPLHKGIIRLESKNYIGFYEQEPSHNKTLLRFAKLDFNLLQILHQKELRYLNGWWKVLHSKLPFTRDRSVEGYFWALGCYYEPQYLLARKIFTKMFMVMQILDDLYDAYGTYDELELLTRAIDRWDYSCVDWLPELVKCGYQTLLETFDEAEQELAKEGRAFCIQYAKKQMKCSCQAWFHEAKWRERKYVPTFDEYMENALVSIGHIMGIVVSYLGMGKIASKEAFEWVRQSPMPMLAKASAVIIRLMNDIGGHKFEQSRNHVASSISCYMEQYGISDEELVLTDLEKQVEDAWKDMNQAFLQPFEVPKPLLDRILNFARVPDVMYKGRTDGYTTVNHTIKHKVASILVDPVPL